MNCTKRYLATTGISEMWDLSSEDILFLGPWCILKEENLKLIAGKAYNLIKSPWKPADKLVKASDFCLITYQDIMPILGEQLNRLHGVDYSQRYWDILIGSWLLQFMEILYDRFKRIESALTLFPGMSTFTLPESICDLTTIDTYDSIIRMMGEDFYNLKLFSLIMYSLYPLSAIVKDPKLCQPERKIAYRKNLFKSIFYSTKKIKDIIVEPKIMLSDMYHYGWQQMLYLEFRCIKEGVSFGYFNDPAKGINTYVNELRCRINLGKHEDKFQCLLRSIIPKALPLSYVENFKEYNDKVRLDNVRAIGSSIGWYFNENFKFLAAKSSLNGVKLLNFQYGGGWATLSSTIDTIPFGNDMFYTWGWSSANNAKALPSPYLAGLMNTCSKSGDNILFIATSASNYVYHLHTDLLPEDILKYGEDKVAFLQHLSGNARDNLIYKPYTQAYGRNDEKSIKNVFPKLRFTSNMKAVDLMKKARLVVIDHPHTSFLESLVINVPSVFFWDHDVFLMKPETSQYFDLLRNAEIVHKDPLSAAKKVNEIFADPLGWWMTKKVQEARIEFCERFAYTRKDWVDIWSPEFNNIISG